MKQPENYEAFLETLALQEPELRLDSKGTLLQVGGLETQEDLALKHLPRLALTGEGVPLSEELPEWNLLGTLGEGGMGIVHRAEQVPLQREVAIKSLQPHRKGPEAMKALLREAWVVGILEHPNIVPIYTLGSDADGAPVFVMKRIEGEAWSALMHSPEHPLRRGRHGDDDLAWNLEVLMQVCNAVHFAHAKGILHRDLKPQNVMIGEFGEVYVLDWGLAVSLKAGEKRPIAHISEVAQMSGTPAYMAPEMVSASGERLSERTDVYLLGAILHEILTGEPPHLADTPMEALYHASVSAPHGYSEAIPQELASICHRAMHREPERRFADVEAFRQALEQFLQRRASHQLVEEAQRVLRALEAGESAGASHHDLFLECRFGFQHALQIWPDNPQARAGLQQLHRRMAERALDQKDLPAATRHVEALEPPDPELRRRLDALRSELESHNQQIQVLQQIAHDADSTIGRKQRIRTHVAAGLVFLFYLPFSKSLGWFSFGYTQYFWSGVAFALFACVFFALGWRESQHNILSRRLMLVAPILSVCALVQFLGSHAMGVTAEQALVQLWLAVAAFTGVYTAILSPKTMGAMLLYFAGFLGASYWPLYLFEFIAFSNLLAQFALLLTMRQDFIASPRDA